MRNQEFSPTSSPPGARPTPGANLLSLTRPGSLGVTLLDVLKGYLAYLFTVLVAVPEHRKDHCRRRHQIAGTPRVD